MQWEASLADKKLRIDFDESEVGVNFSNKERNVADKSILEALARKRKELQRLK